MSSVVDVRTSDGKPGLKNLIMNTNNLLFDIFLRLLALVAFWVAETKLFSHC